MGGKKSGREAGEGVAAEEEGLPGAGWVFFRKSLRRCRSPCPLCGSLVAGDHGVRMLLRGVELVGAALLPIVPVFLGSAPEDLPGNPQSLGSSI